ncbi:MAG: hypothetical protein ACYS0J_07845, partial [Planctomycetota bacterium]
GDPGDAPERLTETERAQVIIDLITESIEPDAWDVNGGDWATIRYYTGTLIIRAPDYIHRQIGGYPFATRPVGRPLASAPARRYLTFTGAATNVELANVRQVKTTGAVGGN